MTETKSTATATPATTIETQTCSRCGGSGNYSYCTMYGTRCFKCGGAGRVYTKRGAVAALHLHQLRSRKHSELEPGMTVQITDVTNGGATFLAWYKVEAITPAADGTLTMDIRHKSGRDMRVLGLLPNEKIRLAQTEEQKAATLNAALEFQATLTNAGTVRVASQNGGAK